MLLLYCCSSLPELLEKKRLIDMHTTIATALLDHIKVRGDTSCQVEERGLADTLTVMLSYFPGREA